MTSAKSLYICIVSMLGIAGALAENPASPAEDQLSKGDAIRELITQESSDPRIGQLIESLRAHTADGQTIDRKRLEELLIDWAWNRDHGRAAYNKTFGRGKDSFIADWKASKTESKPPERKEVTLVKALPFLAPAEPFLANLSLSKSLNPGFGLQESLDYVVGPKPGPSPQGGAAKSNSSATSGGGHTFSGSPAQFSWVIPVHGESSYTVDAAISYNLALSQLWSNDSTVGSIWNRDLKLYLTPGVEAHVSSAKNASQDSVVAQAPLSLITRLRDPNALVVTANPFYATDKEGSIHDYGGQFLMSPIVPALEYPFWFGSTSFFHWQPVFGLEVGHAVGGTMNEQRLDDYTRFLLHIHADLDITDHFVVAGDFYHRDFLSGDPFKGRNPSSFDYGEISPTYYLDPETKFISFGLTYRNGRTMPKFNNVQSLTFFLGLQY